MGERRGAQEVPDAGREGLPHRPHAARSRRSGSTASIRIDSAASPGDWAQGSRREHQADRRDVPAGRDIAEAHGERLAAEGEICWGGMHSWRHNRRAAGDGRTSEDGRLSGRHGAHAALHASGYNAPEDRLLPADFDWSDPTVLDAALAEMTAGAAALDDRLPRRAERRDGEGLGLARQDRPPLPAARPERQARHRAHAGFWLRDDDGQADPRRSSTSAGTAACSPTRS